MRKILLYMLVLGISFFNFLAFTNTSALADSSCTEYTQPNSCTVGPDKESGRLFIVTKCSVNGQTNYSCFNVDTGTFYTQPNNCTVGPYLGNTSGHTYLVKKEGTNSFYCVADCTTEPGLPHCPQTNPAPIGTLDGVDCNAGYAYGWTCDASNYSQPLEVDFYRDGGAGTGGTGLTPSATANITRQDLITNGNVCGGTTNHGFQYQLPDSLYDGQRHTLYAYGINIPSNPNGNTLLTNSGMSFTCAPKNTSPAPVTSPSPSSSETDLQLVIALPGIGYNGNPPLHTTRSVTVELYDPSVQNPGGAGTTPVMKATGTLTYDNGSDNNAGYFVSNTPIKFTNLPANSYAILVKIPQYLYKLAVNVANTTNQFSFPLNPNTTTVLSPLTMVAGDVSIQNGEVNHLNLSDYNVILSCYGDKANSASCPVRPATQGDLNPADLNDDGQVTIADLNIWLRSLRDLQANNAPGCSTMDCQGD